MKIAIISDIHANPLAYDAVSESINKFNPDKIFCLGDLILGGYNPNYICEKIMELKEKMKDDFIIIQGNTDKMIANYTHELAQKVINAFPAMGYSYIEDVKITNKKYVEFVKNLDEKKSLTLNGLKIELVHGSPRKQDENIFPNLKEEEVEKMVEASSADLILCGHTHKPCAYCLNSGKTVVNVGSVGRSMADNGDKRAVYLEVTIDKNSKFVVEHKFVEYDNVQASRHILARNFKHCEDLAKMYV